MYGPTSVQGKRVTWKEVEDLMQSEHGSVFIVGGNFNAILRNSDKRGGMHIRSQSQIDFENFIMRNALMEIPMNEGFYTWTNRRSGFSNIAERLDRFFFGGDLSKFSFTFECNIIP